MVQRRVLFSDGLVQFAYSRPPRRIHVESPRVWILAHLCYRPCADFLFIFEKPLEPFADNRPVSPELPALLHRKRRAIEPDGRGIDPLPHGIDTDSG